MMEHLFEDLLEIGPFKKGNHAFTVWCKQQGLFTVHDLLMTDGESMRACGYNVPLGIERKLAGILTWEKTELIIFIRPSIIRTPDIDGDLQSFAPYLPENLPPTDPAPCRKISVVSAGEGVGPDPSLKPAKDPTASAVVMFVSPVLNASAMAHPI